MLLWREAALARPVSEVENRATAARLVRLFRKEGGRLSCSHGTDKSTEKLALMREDDAAQARSLKLGCGGVELREPAPEAGARVRNGGSLYASPNR